MCCLTKVNRYSGNHWYKQLFPISLSSSCIVFHGNFGQVTFSGPWVMSRRAASARAVKYPREARVFPFHRDNGAALVSVGPRGPLRDSTCSAATGKLTLEMSHCYLTSLIFVARYCHMTYLILGDTWTILYSVMKYVNTSILISFHLLICWILLSSYKQK
jgi:hypothetical protein